MIESLGNALSGMKSFTLKKQSHANNIANMTTGGYSSVRVTMRENPEGGVSVVAGRPGQTVPDGRDGYVNGAADDVDSPSDVDPVTEITESMAADAGFSMNAVAARTADEMLGTVIDIKQ